MDTNDLHARLSVIEHVLKMGFSSVEEKVDGLSTRLDLLNGRVYTGERDRATLDARVARLEGPEKPSRPRTIGVIGAAAGGGIIAIVEAAKAVLSYLQKTP